MQVAAGDILYLLKEGDRLSAGYKLQLAATSATSAPPSPKLPGSGMPDSGHKHSKSAASQAAAAAAACALGQLQAVEADASAKPPQQQVLGGVRLVVWDNYHTQQAVSLAVQAGAGLQRCIDGSTTHVVAR
jgi:hypothetical protein